jgi:hypothetical protein
MTKANPKVADEVKQAPALKIEDAKPEVKEQVKPVTVTELPNGIKIEDY